MMKWILALGLLLLIIPIFIRLLYKIPYIIIGSSIPLIAIFFTATRIKLQNFDEAEYLKSRGRTFFFYRRKNWYQNLDMLKNDLDSTQDKQIYPENFLINDTLNNIVSLLLRDFVQSWFYKISPNDSFISALRHEITYIIKMLHIRLAKVDFSDFLVHNIIPILNDHVDSFLAAQEITRNKKIINKSAKPVERPTNTNDDSILASNYKRGILHPGIKINSSSLEKEVKSYLSSSLAKILPFLIEKNEIKSMPVFILIRELVSSCVLNPICAMLADPDFYNQIIVSSLSKQMNDRNNVKKLRSVLHRQSMTFNDLILTDDQSFNILPYKLSPNTSKKDFDILVQAVENSNDLRTLLKFKYYTILRNQKMLQSIPKSQIEESKSIQKYFERLNVILELIDRKLEIPRETSPFIKTESTLTSTLGKYDLLNISTDKITGDLQLYEILSSTSRLKYFTSYMEQRGERQILLDFWLSVEGLRNPLEFNREHTRAALINLDTIDDDEESSDDEMSMFIDDDFKQADEIKAIFVKYFSLPVMKIPPKMFYKVSEFIQGNSSSKLAYYRARKNILKLQDFEYIRIKKSDFLAFKSSDLWLKLAVEEAVNRDESKMKTNKFTSNLPIDKTLPRNVDQANLSKSFNYNGLYGDPLARYSEAENASNYVDVNMTGKISDKVVKAVEEALNEIIEDTGNADFEAFSASDIRSSRLVSDDVARDLFGGDQESLFGDDETKSNSNDTDLTRDTSVINNPGLSNNHQDSVSMRSDSSDINQERLGPNDLRVVAPSVLNLSNEIERLDVEIDRLQKQRMIIKTLLKKAEIINNLPELRILKKSLISLEKELKLKLMQKEQYVVQEGENSLYERAKVSIPNYITAKDNTGKDFIMYVIKVIKLSQLDSKQISASWMVTRRFSQFYDLHNYLKSKYPEVSLMDFPKKKMIIKFRQGTLVEERQTKLKIYLQDLVKNKDVCSDKIFRDFLSSETFDTTLNNKLHHVNQDLKKQGDGSGTKLYNIISSQALYPLLSLTNYKGMNEQMDDQLILDKSLEDSQTLSETGDRSNEDIVSQETKLKDVSFVKPICDLIVLVFQLNSSTSWLRGKALILLFQQLFGSTVEKVLRTNVDGKIKQEDTVSKILTGLESTLWPDGNFKKKKAPRTAFEKKRSKQQAKLLLSSYLTDISSKIFGQNAANEAADTIYHIIQNEILNYHLALSILDECFKVLFPELMSS